LEFQDEETLRDLFVRTLTVRERAASISPSRSPLKNFEPRVAKIDMPSTEIILTENIPGLGAEADVVKVRRGYARNYLLPRGKAYEVTPATLHQLDNLKKKRAEREGRELNEAEEVSRRIEKLSVTFTMATGETGKAFGSITAQDIVNRIKSEIGLEIDRHKIVLERPIKDTGEHEVPIKLHHDVTAHFKFDVKSAEPPKIEQATAPAAEADKKHRSFFRRKSEEHKEEK
jgi:large subunit ribosomal protein L9